MSNVICSSAFLFDKDTLQLKLNISAKAFTLTEIRLARSVIKYLFKNHISTLTLDISEATEVDSNIESLLYQIASYIEDDKQRSLTLKADDNLGLQQVLVSNLIKICPSIDIEFLVLSS